MRALALLAIAGMLLTACQATPSTTSSGAAQPAGLDDAVVNDTRAFDDHPVVAVGESHRSVAEHESLRALISDPRLATVIDDVAVEFGSARHQDVMDRYVSGANVDDASAAGMDGHDPALRASGTIRSTANSSTGFAP